MRLRNIPGADDVIKAHPIAIKNVKEYKGKWNTLFENENPIHIEIGMGKGQFILNLAKQNVHFLIHRILPCQTSLKHVEEHWSIFQRPHS